MKTYQGWHAGTLVFTVTVGIFCGAQAKLLAEDLGNVNVIFRPLDAALAKGTYTVSFIKDGKIAFQDEKAPNCPNGDCQSITRNPFIAECSLPAGSYDVRVEGEGAITIAKNSVAVIAGQTRALVFDLHPGQGVKVIEYATGGLSREEVAARIKKLEATVEELKTKR